MARKLSKGIFNRHLREERLRHGWSQRDVADRIGTTTNNVSRWELGQTTPWPYFRSKLCDLFERNLKELGLIQDQEGEHQGYNQTSIILDQSGANFLAQSLSWSKTSSQ